MSKSPLQLPLTASPLNLFPFHILEVNQCTPWGDLLYMAYHGSAWIHECLGIKAHLLNNNIHGTAYEVGIV